MGGCGGKADVVRIALPLPPRPVDAVGFFLRAITINDVYKLDNYARVATAVNQARAVASSMKCVVTSHCNGDFISPCILTAVDGGIAMVQGLNRANIQYACLGNHEFDIGIDELTRKLKLFTGKLINSNVVDAQLAHIPRFDVLTVGTRTAVIAGCVTGNRSTYSTSVPTADPVAPALAKVWAEAKAATGTLPDLLLPMTHQLIADDEASAQQIAASHPEIADRMPVILGGHEHTAMVVKAGKSTIIKVGEDATKVGFVDVWWASDGKVKSSCTTVEASAFPEDADAKAFAQKQERHLSQLMAVPILQVDSPVSSKGVRFAPCELASILLHYVKRGLGALGVEITVMNAGNFRGRRDYDAGPFTMENMYTEWPFDNEMAHVQIPGYVLRDAILASRSGEGQKPGYLHADLDVTITDEHELVEVDSKPFEPGKTYTVAILVHLLSGMDNVAPLVDYVRSSGLHVPGTECCTPSKHSVLKACMRDAWRQLLGLDPWNARHPQRVPQAEVRQRIGEIFRQMDSNKDGWVSREECATFLSSKKVPLVTRMFEELDVHTDGRISLEAFIHLAQ